MIVLVAFRKVAALLECGGHLLNLRSDAVTAVNEVVQGLVKGLDALRAVPVLVRGVDECAQECGRRLQVLNALADNGPRPSSVAPWDESPGNFKAGILFGELGDRVFRNASGAVCTSCNDLQDRQFAHQRGKNGRREVDVIVSVRWANKSDGVHDFVDFRRVDHFPAVFCPVAGDFVASKRPVPGFVQIHCTNEIPVRDNDGCNLPPPETISAGRRVLDNDRARWSDNSGLVRCLTHRLLQSVPGQASRFAAFKAIFPQKDVA